MLNRPHDKELYWEGNRIACVDGAKAIYRILICNTYGHKIVRLKEQVSCM